jgi:hypothetical protein
MRGSKWVTEVVLENKKNGREVALVGASKEHPTDLKSVELPTGHVLKVFHVRGSNGFSKWEIRDPTSILPYVGGGLHLGSDRLQNEEVEEVADSNLLFFNRTSIQVRRVPLALAEKPTTVTTLSFGPNSKADKQGNLIPDNISTRIKY